MPDIGPDITSLAPDTPPPVHAAWARVMADVRAVSKDDRNQEQNYNFRGIDAVMNAVGPVLRAHGVAVIPSRIIEVSHRDVLTSRGKPSRECTLTVEYTVIGPAGDTFTFQAPGEAMDFGDKGTPKAMSVAMRTGLLQALCLPTQDTDPDAEAFERAAGPPPVDTAAQQERDAAYLGTMASRINAATTQDELRALWRAEAARRRAGQISEAVFGQVGEMIRLYSDTLRASEAEAEQAAPAPAGAEATS